MKDLSTQVLEGDARSIARLITIVENNSSDAIDAMKKANIKLIRNKGYWVKKNAGKIKIGGVGDMWEDTQDITTIIKDVKKQDFVIIVSPTRELAGRG